MSVKNKTNKNYKRSQKGRSMVEMLGVLAIVGVLSVGGVYGYGVAMKKHKANELLHQASMQASSIAAQIASGKTDLALDNFGNSSNGSFSSVKGPDGSSNYQSGDDKFTMQITDMDEAVCKQMQAIKGGTVRSVSCGTPDANGKVTATLAFNKDLSSTPVASDFDGKQNECEASGHNYCLDSNSCVASDKECPCNPSDIVKVYDCETKKTTDCCSTTQTCEQPVCSCDGDDDCPGQQVCQGGTCSCPTSYDYKTGTLGSDGQTCCLNSYGWVGVNYAYDSKQIDVCGCPGEGGIVSKTNPDVCCYNGYADENYTINTEACGCPDHLKPSTTVPNVCCDQDNWSMVDGYSGEVNIEACGGCPNGSTESTIIPGICCDDYVFAEVITYSQYRANHEACGRCPRSPISGNSGTLKGETCCYDGKRWSVLDYDEESEDCL